MTAQEFSEALAQRMRSFDSLRAKDPAALRIAKHQVIDHAVAALLAKSYAQKVGITVAPSEIDTRVAEVRKRYPDEFAFRRQLSQENLSFDAWRRGLAVSLTQEKISRRLTQSVREPSDAEMKDYYEDHKKLFNRAARIRLRQVVLEKEGDADRILEELSSGANLGALARKFSIAPEAAQNGDTGWVEKGTLEFFDQAFKLQVGARSRVVKSPYGFHIYEVLAKEPDAHLSFAEARARVRALLIEQQGQALYSAWLDEQIRKSSVWRDDALIDALTVTTRGD